MKAKQFVAGVVVGAILGGLCAGTTVRFLNRQDYQFINVPRGLVSVLKFNKRTGESYGLTVDGQWIKLTTQQPQ
ncbi:MAG: hypothetical protein ACLQU4_00500 [Limisphaerales bacterium]